MTSITVSRAVIQLGDINLDVFRLSTGTYQLSAEGTGRAIGKPRNGMLRFLQSNSRYAASHHNDLDTKNKIPVENEKTRIWTISPRMAVDFWLDEHHKGNQAATSILFDICHLKHSIFVDLCAYIFQEMKPQNKTLKAKSVGKEYQVVSRLHKRLGGEREVITEAGKIDLLTPSEIIECKKVNSWKSAIGQVIVYGLYYPSHQKRIHLFGSCHESMMTIIQKHCDKLNIVLTWETP